MNSRTIECVLLLLLATAGVQGQGVPSWRQPPVRRYVAVAGAGAYQVGTPWPVLQATTNDAMGVATLFRSRLGYELVEPPLKDPTEPMLRSWLSSLSQKLEHADELIVFMTGHGASGQFVSVDGRFTPVTTILETLFRLPVRRLLVILHFCYSGDRSQLELPSAQPEFLREVIASGRDKVFNVTDKSLEYSPFTLSLLDYFDERLTNYTIPRQVTAEQLAAKLAANEPEPGRKAVFLKPFGGIREAFAFDLDGRETDVFRRAISEPGAGGAALRAYLDRFTHGMYEREAWALIENIEKEKRESQNLNRYRGSLRGGEDGDRWFNLRRGAEDPLPYVWIPATSPIRTGRERLEPAKLASDLGGFWMTQTEIPVSAYRRTAERMPRAPGFDRGWNEDHQRQPMVNISLIEARVFCTKEGGRLPTSAEWEYAARAQQTGDTFGQDRPDGFANLRGKRCPGAGEDCGDYDHYPNVAPVDQMRTDVNDWLLMGMAGNVSEITDDPEQKGGEQTIATMWIIGANFSDSIDKVPLSFRRTVYAGGANTVGFRCVIPYGK